MYAACLRLSVLVRMFTMFLGGGGGGRGRGLFWQELVCVWGEVCLFTIQHAALTFSGKLLKDIQFASGQHPAL